MQRHSGEWQRSEQSQKKSLQRPAAVNDRENCELQSTHGYQESIGHFAILEAEGEVDPSRSALQSSRLATLALGPDDRGVPLKVD